jgi:hypothetical protein
LTPEKAGLLDKDEVIDRGRSMWHFAIEPYDRGMTGIGRLLCG